MVKVAGGEVSSGRSFGEECLCITASSASAERTYSVAGNIGTPKRNCPLPENVAQPVFLFQNRAMFI
jgi:hypothetical protein